jgi:hypothetical protein
MSRKSLLIGVGIIVLAIGATTGTLVLMVLHEPEFYRRSGIPAGEQRQKWSREFRREALDLYSGITGYKNWGARFSEQQINSYLAEDLLRTGGVERAAFPEGFSDPRVSIDQDRIRLGFRYGGKRWSAIVSIDLRVWLVENEPNVIALQVEQMRVGSLPITVQSLLERFAEAVRRQDIEKDIEMSWYRHNGKPVALVRIAPGRKDPAVQLLQVKMHPGMMSLRGADRSKPSAGETGGPTPRPGSAKS